MRATGRLFIGLWAVSHAAGFFIMPCSKPVVVERADPIVNPGALAGHVHTIMGGNGFDLTMTYEQARAASCSTCKVTADLSNYWIPTLYYQGQDGKFTSVSQSGGMLAYYLFRQDAKDPEYNNGLIAFPQGFRMLAGDSKLRSFSNTLEQRAITYVCLGNGGPQTNGFPTRNCPNGLRVQVLFPSCWDGVNLDSLDHKSHMAYPDRLDNGKCPSTHPKRFATLFYEVIFNVNDFKDKWYGENDTQPFVLSNGDPTGYGLHGDFVNGWDVNVLQAAITQCKDGGGSIEKCPVFQFFDDETRRGCQVPVKVDEQVQGQLDKLPGCNSIQRGPGNAQSESGCGATTEISQPQWGYKDVTSTLNYKYLGCARDPSGQGRTLPSAKTSGDSMTVDTCIKHCDGKGFAYAGLEYARECWCGNSVADDRKPKKGLWGGCNMPCSGSQSEMCGGWAALSLYQKCNGTCQNAELI
ncbi:wsc domain-containing protein [Colletotrichum incanum]|uniref:Wsc domain-containing protein n=1 Tax=Colletotrichum incanum TaxID=1573173 RepID=A0A167CTX9_COLIC|nr:wsc domain-containing protein [Colletotrichum incanum]OHW99413.1 WSC domain-containing protein [Colletotrichum incanum]